MAELNQLLESELGDLEPVLPTPPTILPEVEDEENVDDIKDTLPDVPTHNPAKVFVRGLFKNINFYQLIH